MMFPLFVSLEGRLCLVVGGGAVGLRKATSLRDAGAHVRLVCLEPRPADTPPGLDWLTERYHADHLNGVVLAVAAGNSAVNRRVVIDARLRGIWVNSATEPETGDTIFPATFARGDLVVAVGTGGHAPALASEIRDRLAEKFDDTFALWITLLAELRPIIRECVPARRRRVLFEKLSDWGWLKRLRRDSAEAVRAAMIARIRALAKKPLPPL